MTYVSMAIRLLTSDPEVLNGSRYPIDISNSVEAKPCVLKPMACASNQEIKELLRTMAQSEQISGIELSERGILFSH